jgi:hypothetical protein
MTTPNRLFLALLATSSFFVGGALWAANDVCITIEVDDPMRLPDGSVHDAGRLTLCDSMAYSPVSSLHRTYVNGRPFGMLRSRKTKNEGGSDVSPVVLFHRNLDGQLELFGYVLPDRSTSVTYLFGETARVPRSVARNTGRRGADDAPSVARSWPSQTSPETVVAVAPVAPN